jgi:hypothetical protein
MEGKEPIQFPKYPALRRALGANSEEFKLIQEAYSRSELIQHEHDLTEKWDANFLPKLIAEAKKRLGEKDRLKQAA